MMKSETTMGIALGVGAALVAPMVLAGASGMGRPLARAAFKSGTVFYEKTRETLAEFGEVLDDLVAEVRAEHEAGEQQRAGGLTRAQSEVAASVAEAVRQAEAKHGGNETT